MHRPVEKSERRKGSMTMRLALIKKRHKTLHPQEGGGWKLLSWAVGVQGNRYNNSHSTKVTIF